MTDGLSVIRRAYGLDGAAPASGADAIEAAVLDHSIRALDALPASAPDPEVLARIYARAAEASDLQPLAAVRGAYSLGSAQPTVEGALLAQSVEALEMGPREAPSPEALDAVLAFAQQATFAAVRAASGEETVATDGPELAILQQSLAALDTLPASAPDVATIEAILDYARQATFAPLLSALGEADHEEASPEAALLSQSLSALDALPVYAPSEASMDAVMAFASGGTFHAVRAAWGEADAVDSPEAALLAQSRQALDSLPAYAPTDASMEAVAAFALEATFQPVRAAWGEAEAPATPEAALLAQSRRALDALPAYAPSDAALAAIMAAAATASGGVTAPARRQEPAGDRSAVREARPSRRAGAWMGGLATLAVAVIAAVVFLQPPADVASPEAVMDQVEIAQAAPTPSPAVPLAEAEPVEALAPVDEPPAPAPQPRPLVARSAPSGPSEPAGDFQTVAARRETPRARTASAPSPEADVASAQAVASRAAASRDVDAPTEWEAGEDLRLLSLRLRQLREQNSGIEWDDPATSLDGRSGGATGTTQGLQVVREAAPIGRALVRTPAPTTDRR